MPDRPRETLGFEVVVRFFPGSEREAVEFARALEFPEQAKWIRVDRIVLPEGEERHVQLSRGRTGVAYDGDVCLGAPYCSCGRKAGQSHRGPISGG